MYNEFGYADALLKYTWHEIQLGESLPTVWLQNLITRSMRQTVLSKFA